MKARRNTGFQPVRPARILPADPLRAGSPYSAQAGSLCSAALALALLFFFSANATSQTLPKDQLARVDFEQRLGQRVPLNTIFRDESGASVRLGSLFGERPVILALAYYECPNLCTLVLNGLLESARDLRLEAGRDFEIVVVSINPKEPATLAAAKRQTYTTRYGRPGSARGWHFLTGDAEPIRQLSDAVGFRYLYDPASKQYAHASGIVVLTPDGIVSRYFLGIEYPPKDVQLALAAASQKKVGTFAERLLLLCFHYDPTTGRYSLLITRVMQFAGTGTVLMLAAFIARMSRRRSTGFQPVGPADILSAEGGGGRRDARPPHSQDGRAPKTNGAPLFAALPFLSERASDIAGSVDAIFFTLLAVCGLVIAGIFTAVLVFCIRYRAGSSARRQPRERSIGFEIAWTSATLLIFTAIFVWAAIVYFRMSQPPANASEIHVVAKQWMWKLQHPNGRSEINELHLLLGQPVKLVMTSQDVIHDFFVPAFRTKQDVLPGRYTAEWFTPTKPGKYHLFCAEYCGMDHSQMGGWVYVLQPSDFAYWLAEQQSSESMVAAGARLFQARGCSGCHAPNAVVRAPLLNGIYRKPVALSDGTTIIADDQYLHDSILLPNKHISAGYEAKMPTFQGQLGEEEVMELISYIKAL